MDSSLYINSVMNSSQYYYPVKTVLQEISKSCKYFSCKTCKILHKILQDLQDLAQNLASLALNMKLFLQDIKNLARILKNLARKICKMIFLQDLIKILQKIVLQIFLQDSSYLARKASFLVQDLASLARKLLA